MAVSESEILIPDELITNKIYLIRGEKEYREVPFAFYVSANRGGD